MRRAANLLQRFSPPRGRLPAHFFQQIGDQCIEHALESLVRAQPLRRARILSQHGVVKTAEERHALAHLG